MEKKSYFINGVGIISPQFTFDNGEFLSRIQAYENNILTCVAPDFKTYLNPIQLRRLSRLLRIGLSAAIICMRDAKNESPDGIITATGYGLLDDTSKFLVEMLELGEQKLTPTHFMQSTYNSLGGLVALHVKCTGYNTTYVSKGFAFETALSDAMMQLDEGRSQNFLVGAYDEAGATQYAVNRKAGHYKAEPINSLNLFENNTVGSLQGEGAAFFSVSTQVDGQTWCRLKDFRMIYRPGDDELAASLSDFLAANVMPVEDIDVFISGASGDVHNDRKINSIAQKWFSQSVNLRFKHLCGEYCTASSFALWMGASVLKKQHIPISARMNEMSKDMPLRTVLIVNQYRDKNYTFMLLQRA